MAGGARGRSRAEVNESSLTDAATLAVRPVEEIRSQPLIELVWLAKRGTGHNRNVPNMSEIYVGEWTAMWKLVCGNSFAANCGNSSRNCGNSSR